MLIIMRSTQLVELKEAHRASLRTCDPDHHGFVATAETWSGKNQDVGILIPFVR